MLRYARTGVVGVALFAAACSSEHGTAPAARSPDMTLGSMRATPFNAIMAVGDTLRIAVDAKTLSGDPLPALDSVLYVLQSTTDTLRVQVSPTGLVTARAPSGSSLL